MSSSRNAFSVQKHRDVKHLSHKEKCVYISTQDIFNAIPNFGEKDYWGYVRDRFRKEHGVEITDTEKLVLYTTLDDNIMKVAGHIGYSLSEPKE